MIPLTYAVSTYDKMQVLRKKPDHPVWRSIANWMVIVGGPVGEFVIQIAVPEQYKKIASIAWASIIAGLKGFSKLTVDPKTEYKTIS